jgi:hypothetical protein
MLILKKNPQELDQVIVIFQIFQKKKKFVPS